MYNLVTMGGQHFGVSGLLFWKIISYLFYFFRIISLIRLKPTNNNEIDLPGCLDVNGTICDLGKNYSNKK